MSGTKGLPLVEVAWWDSSGFHIRCPYCDEIHCHGFVSYANGSRQSDCVDRKLKSRYEYTFPANYEIDKEKALFVGVDALKYMGEYCDDDAEPLVDELSSLTLLDTSEEIFFEDASETTAISMGDQSPLEILCIDIAISFCAQGDVYRVKQYLTTSAEKSILIRGKEHKSGDTALIMVSTNKSSPMVSLLLDHGAEMNARNKQGRTALMEASLWGRFETVKILLSRGADQYLRDDNNRTALDLTQPTRRNRKERHTRAGGCWGDPTIEPIYKEDVVSRDADRREIARILGGTNEEPARVERPQQVLDPARHSFMRSADNQSISYFGPVQDYPIPKHNKTVAVLQRGPHFPIIPSMSGWSHAECSSIRVSGHDWTEKVLRLARVVGYKLQSHRFDGGARGQYYASHAEKQLIAYFVDRHVFMSEDKRPDPSFDAEIEKLTVRIEEKAFAIAQLGRLQEERQEVELELSNKDNISLGEAYDEQLVQELNMRVKNIDEQCASLRKCSTVMEIRDMESQIRKYEHQKRVHGRLNRLWEIAPNERLNQASVFISASKAEICEDCRSFTKRVNDSFRLSIRLHECTT